LVGLESEPFADIAFKAHIEVQSASALEGRGIFHLGVGKTAHLIVEQRLRRS
jgi:hypothetical protein